MIVDKQWLLRGVARDCELTDVVSSLAAALDGRRRESPPSRSGHLIRIHSHLLIW